MHGHGATLRAGRTRCNPPARGILGGLFARVTIRAADPAASERFYATVLDAAGIAPSGAARWGEFAVAPATPGRPPTRRLHVGFAVASRAAVDAFWAAGRRAGHPDAGAPGERPHYTDGYYGAFLLDPGGTSAEAVHHPGVRRDGAVDHLWLRVADLAASARFYAAIAPAAGLRVTRDTAERATYVPRAPDAGGTFSLVPGDPTEHLHMAFPVPDAATARVFHDPDGNRIELVHRGGGA